MHRQNPRGGGIRAGSRTAIAVIGAGATVIAMMLGAQAASADTITAPPSPSATSTTSSTTPSTTPTTTPSSTPAPSTTSAPSTTPASPSPHAASPLAAPSPAGPPPCVLAEPGTHHGPLTITGFCVVPFGTKTTVTGNVTIAPNSTLLALAPATVTVKGDISVGAGAVLALGTPAEGTGPTSHDRVTGNITANNAKAMDLFGVTVNGSVSFIGGGWGPTCTDPGADTDPNDPIGHDTMVKDSHIGGSLTISNWAGCWMGALRNHVGGTMTITHNYANPDNINDPVPPKTEPTKQGLDSTEIAANVVGGDLVCIGNTPKAQIGDSHAALNTVHGKAIGECASLVTATTPTPTPTKTATAPSGPVSQPGTPAAVGPSVHTGGLVAAQSPQETAPWPLLWSLVALLGIGGVSAVTVRRHRSRAAGKR